MALQCVIYLIVDIGHGLTLTDCQAV